MLSQLDIRTFSLALHVTRLTSALLKFTSHHITLCRVCSHINRVSITNFNWKHDKEEMIIWRSGVQKGQSEFCLSNTGTPACVCVCRSQELPSTRKRWYMLVITYFTVLHVDLYLDWRLVCEAKRNSIPFGF